MKTISPREQFSMQYLRVKQWYTPERFRFIWRKAKFTYWVNGSKSPLRNFVWDVGVSRRTVSRWLNGARPSRMALIRLEGTCRALWGEDWMEDIDDMIKEDRHDYPRNRESS